jgi:hypothetical protein
MSQSTLVAIVEPSSVTIYPGALEACGIKIPEDLSEGDSGQNPTGRRYLVPNDSDGAKLWLEEKFNRDGDRYYV